MAVFNFDRGFWLLLSGGARIRFEEGVQTVPDEIADHWYLAANGTRVETIAASEAPVGESVTEEPDGSVHIDSSEEITEKSALQAQALALGLAVDGRWGIARLQSEIATAEAKKVQP